MQSIHTIWIAADAESFIMETYDLISFFGIPDGHKMMLRGIAYACGNADRSLHLTVDPKLKGPQQGTVAGLAEGVMGRISLAAALANEQYTLDIPGDHGMELVDELHFLDAIGAGTTWNITFFYDLVPGDMRTIDDDGLRVGDITQVTPDRTPGKPLFQLGPITQIGSAGEDIE